MVTSWNVEGGGIVDELSAQSRASTSCDDDFAMFPHLVSRSDAMYLGKKIYLGFLWKVYLLRGKSHTPSDGGKGKG